MKPTLDKYEVCVVGAGLAGLASAILLARAGHSVIVFEKEVYPVHKVCGEYISLESWDFLTSLGIPLEEWDLPKMTTLRLTGKGGTTLQHRLPLGGFGVSRHRLDFALLQCARAAGAEVIEGTKVDNIEAVPGGFVIAVGGSSVTARVCCGAFGKRANIDVRWNRPFIRRKPDALNNYIGVKYHAVTRHPRDHIALHQFPGGYCGVAAIEGGLTNICYLTSAANLQEAGNITAMEEAVLHKNRFLKTLWESAKMITEKPLVISQVSFDTKEKVFDHALLTGDAAGLIAPLCGNGMSIALRSGAIAASAIDRFLTGACTRDEMEHGYAQQWNRIFAGRMRAGRLLQRLFYQPALGDAAIRLLKPFPFISRRIIKSTHGRPWTVA